jgi:hypothetical protein
MSDTRREELLLRYAARKLSPEEESELLRLAYDDQEVFEALSHEHSLRELLDDEECRDILLNAAEPAVATQRPSWFAGLFSRRIVFAGALAALAVAAIVISTRHPDGPIYTPAGNQPAKELPGVRLRPETRAALEALAAKAPAGGQGLSLRFPGGDSFPMGGTLAAEFSSSRSAALLLVEFAAAEPGRVVFPAPPGNQARVSAGQAVAAPPASAKIDGLPGKRQLVLLAFPPDTNIAACLRGATPWPEPYAVTTSSYSVQPR